jgi:membrane-associated phospholipid phosphatase
VSAAIGAASVVVLKAFFPADAALIESYLDAQESSARWPGAKHADFAAGEAIGRTVGAEVMAWAQTDRVGLTNPLLPPYGPVPLTEGSWVYNGGPIARAGLGARPFFLTSASQIRPAPPPTFGSAEFNAALAEVVQIATNRTAEQLAIANYWNTQQSPRTNAALMAIARELIVSHRRSDTEAARIMFLMGAASFDAILGCFDAKYTYWVIRPIQANAAIPTAFPTPPHPSYPSAHSCVSGAMVAVLIDAFPSERARLEAVAIEASLSRVYAGIHYRFDGQAGLKLGADAAAIALAADTDGTKPLP